MVDDVYACASVAVPISNRNSHHVVTIAVSTWCLFLVFIAPYLGARYHVIGFTMLNEAPKISAFQRCHYRGGGQIVSMDTTQYNGGGFPLFQNKRYLIHMHSSTKCHICTHLGIVLAFNKNMTVI